MRLLYSCLAAVLLLLLTATGGLAGMAQFDGSWTNVDTNTRGITKLDIAVMGTNAKVQGWGSCHPTRLRLGDGAGTGLRFRRLL